MACLFFSRFLLLSSIYFQVLIEKDLKFINNFKPYKAYV